MRSISIRERDIYVGDAIDYMQDGTVTRYNASGDKTDSFTTGSHSRRLLLENRQIIHLLSIRI